MAAAYSHRPQLLARARRVVVDRYLAEEAVQEAYLRAWRACATFDPDGSPLVNWLLAITGNVAIDLVRARAAGIVIVSDREPVGRFQRLEPRSD